MRLFALHDSQNGVSAPVVIAVIIVLSAAWLYHSVVDHHLHLWLWRVVRPETVIPETNHDSRWHQLSHPWRLLADILMIGAAILAGLAWELAPVAVAVIVILAAMAGVTMLIVRYLSGHASPGGKS